MGKFNQLLGVANNLADSFVSVTNIEFLKQGIPLVYNEWLKECSWNSDSFRKLCFLRVLRNPNLEDF